MGARGGGTLGGAASELGCPNMKVSAVMHVLKETFEVTDTSV